MAEPGFLQLSAAAPCHTTDSWRQSLDWLGATDLAAPRDHKPHKSSFLGIPLREAVAELSLQNR